MRDKFFLFVILTMIIGGIYLYFKGIIDFRDPEIYKKDELTKTQQEKTQQKEKEEYKIIGKKYLLELVIKDDNAGIKNISIFINQEGEDKYKEVIEIPQRGIKKKELKILIDADKYNLKKGEADLIVSVSDYGLFENKKPRLFKFIIDPEPPKIERLYSQMYIMNGGSAFAFFKVSKDTTDVYIQMENLKFKCLSGVFNDKTIYTCVFPYPYYWNRKKDIYVYAKDKAGNITTQKIPYRFKVKRYRKSVINVSERLINKARTLVSDKHFSDEIEMFKYVNVKLREENEKKIHSITKNIVIIKPQFKGKFAVMKKAAVLGGFADYRKYKYKGKIIEGADAYHKGLDMASIKNAEVPAAEDGIVVFTGFLGIYGNTIIIEHGLGVFTLYSHLLDFKVKKGEKVKKDQIIAHTDTTGLALGDHLHFGVLIQGLEVHPIEWLDKKWLKTRFFDEYNRLKKLTENSNLSEINNAKSGE